MYLSHYKFTRQPFRSAVRPCGSFFAAYHQDVYGMLAEKSTVPGIAALFSDDEDLLATFTGPMDAVKARGVLAAWAVLTGGAMVAADVRTGLAALVGAGLACVYYVVTARRQFGGVTGDLAGFFLQLCELGMVLCAAVGQRLEVLL